VIAFTGGSEITVDGDGETGNQADGHDGERGGGQIDNRVADRGGFGTDNVVVLRS
jgi:hypothetical protein